MIASFLLYDLRRSVPLISSLWLSITAVVLFLLGPLPGAPRQWFMFHLLGYMTGMLLASWLSCDTGGTQAFVYSRGMTRRWILFLRMMLGVSQTLVLAGWIWLGLKIGLRERLHVYLKMPDNIFYPMSTQFETDVVVKFLANAMVALGFTFFYVTWRGLCRPSANSTWNGLVPLILFELLPGSLTLWVMSSFCLINQVLPTSLNADLPQAASYIAARLYFGAIMAVVIAIYAAQDVEIS